MAERVFGFETRLLVKDAEDQLVFAESGWEDYKARNIGCSRQRITMKNLIALFARRHPMFGNALLRRRCCRIFAALTSLVLVGCASTPDSDAVENEEQTCYATLIDDQVNACLTINNGLRLRVAELDATPRLSGPLPDDFTLTLKSLYTIGAGFRAFWIGYSGHPFGVIRVDADTLEATAKIPVDTGWSSRHFGSMGTIAVGSRAVYALSEQKLHRIDPNDAAVVTSVEYPRAGDVFADGDQLWLAQGNAVSRLDPYTLAVLEVYMPPPETAVGWRGRWNADWPERLPTFVRDAKGMKIVLSDLIVQRFPNFLVDGKGFKIVLSDERIPGQRPARLPVLRFGRLDPTTKTIVVTEGTPLPHEIAPLSYLHR
jgi:hypothetical protein